MRLQVFRSSFVVLIALAGGVDARMGADRRLQQLSGAQRAAVDQILNPPPLELVEIDQSTSESGTITATRLLQLCQGDCDADDQCETPLICLARAEGDVVEGCSEGTVGFSNDRDFCVHPLIDFLGIGPGEGTSANGNPLYSPDLLPFGLCQGDCDNDRDCGDGLICWQRNYRNDTAPGCSGLDAFNAEWNRPSDFCVPTIYAGTASALGIVPPPSPSPTEAPEAAPTTAPVATEAPAPTIGQLTLSGNDGLPLDRFPLQMCQGDCDNDDECGAGLICLSRNGGDPVPGCEGDLSRGVDYCVLDPDDPSN